MGARTSNKTYILSSSEGSQLGWVEGWTRNAKNLRLYSGRITRSSAARSILLYGGATGGAQASTFVLLALYARRLSPADYGSYSLFTGILALGASILTLGLIPAFFRFYTKAPKEVPSTVLCCVIASILFSYIVAIAGREYLNPLMFGELTSLSVYVLVLGALGTEVALQVPLTHMRADGQSQRYAVVVVVRTLTLLACGVLMVAILRMGFHGAIVAAVVSATMAATLAFILKRPPLVRPSRPLLAAMLAFGLPLQLTIVFNWTLTYADRYMIVIFDSRSALAPYSAVMFLASGVNGLLQASFSLFWTPVMYRLASRIDAARIFGRVATACIGIFILVNASLTVFSEPLLAFVAPRYIDAAAYLPIVALSYAVFSPFIFLNSAFQIASATKWTLIAIAIGVVANLGGNLLLIPHFGATGAAFALLLGYILPVALAWPVAQKVYPMDYQWRELSVLGAFMISTTVIKMLVNSVLVAGIAIFGVGVLALGVVIRGDVLQWTKPEYWELANDVHAQEE